MRKGLRYRLLVLVSACFLTFGSFYCFAMPNVLASELTDVYNISPNQLSWFMNIYNIPNLIAPAIGGSLVDKGVGKRRSVIATSCLVFIGQLIWAISYFLAPTSFAYWMALFGRFIFALGGDILVVVQSSYTAKWFSSKEIALAFSFTMSISGLGDLLNSILSPYIEEYLGGVATVLWFGVFLCFLSLVSCGVLVYLDTKAEPEVKPPPKEKPKPEKKTDKESQSKPTPKKVHSPSALCLFSLLFGASILSFSALLANELQIEYYYSTVSKVFKIPGIIVSLLGPLGGYIIDKTGRFGYWLLLSTLLVTLSHIIAIFGSSNIIIVSFIYIILGVAFIAYGTALKPSAILIVPRSQLGKLLGLLNSFKNIGYFIAYIALFAFPLSFTQQILVQTGFSVLAVISVILVLFFNYRETKTLLINIKKQKENKEKQPLIIQNESSEIKEEV